MTDASGLDVCAACGQTLHDGEWHPVVTDRTADGELTLYSFCDDDCRSAWAAPANKPLDTA